VLARYWQEYSLGSSFPFAVNQIAFAVAIKSAQSESTGLTGIEREEACGKSRMRERKPRDRRIFRQLARARAREIVPVFPRVVCADNI